MKIVVKEIKSKVEKGKIAENILTNLPEWFGLSESNKEYVDKSKDKIFLAAYVENEIAGFLVINPTSSDCSEIFVIGVKKEFHRMGIGTSLHFEYEKIAKKLGFSYLQVKTVKSGYYKEYDITNKFYLAMSYKKFECFPNLWDETNPCQIYVKYIGDNKK